MKNRKNYNLFLDDIREPNWVTQYKTDPTYNKLKWVIVRTHDDFVDYITDNGMPSLISFDHDLADEHYAVYDRINVGIDVKLPEFKEKTGYESLKWVCDYALDNDIQLSEMKFHTANYVGMKNMSTYYNNFIKHYPELK